MKKRSGFIRRVILSGRMSRKGVPLLLTLLPFAALEPDFEVHTEILSVCENSARLRFHGTGVKNLRIHWKHGKKETRFLDLHHAGAVLEMELTASEGDR